MFGELSGMETVFVGRQSGKKKPKKTQTVKKPERPRREPQMASDDSAAPQEVIRHLMSNRPGAFGFLLSILQLLGHASWIAWVWYLSATGKATTLNADSWTSWGIVGLLAVSLILTFTSLFVCLVFGLRRSPRMLPLIGFCLSFFVGSLASGLVFLQGIRSMSGQ